MNPNDFLENVDARHYALRLEPDLETFRFKGTVDATLELKTPSDLIYLHASKLVPWKCTVNVGKKAIQPTKLCILEKEELLEIKLPEEISGEFTVHVEFEGIINDQLVGFYRSKYKYKGKTRYIAVTQFEECYARLAYPCLDHPKKKATFDVELVVDKNLEAISNNEIEKTEEIENNKKVVKFKRTPKMSTYLLFFGVGQFSYLKDTSKKTVVRVAALPGKKKYSRFALSFGRKSLEFGEEYFAIPYPFPKLDLIGVPDFAFGAMENWGAITFRENLLYYSPKIASKMSKQRIAEVIAHEIAHQWFGNLVSPADWKYLWLNESFATYFGYGVVARYYPKWDVWSQFLASETSGAFERDSLINTIPIEMEEGDEHLAISASTAPIIYNKGGSMLRMIERYLGREKFREGLRHYLKKFQYDVAISDDLWKSLEHVSKRSITKMMKSWLKQPGFPMVEVKRIAPDMIELSQKRFTYLDHDTDQTWMIPVIIRQILPTGQIQSKKVLLRKKSMTVKINKDILAYKVNADQAGFYHVLDEKENLDNLATFIKEKKLNKFDRWGIQADMFAMVRKGELELDYYLSYLENYMDETEFLVVNDIVGNLQYLSSILDGTKWHGRIKEVKMRFIENVLNKIGWEYKPGEKHVISILRNTLLSVAALEEHEKMISLSKKLFDDLVNKEKTIEPNIRSAVYIAVARSGDKNTLDQMIELYKKAQTEQERNDLIGTMVYFKDKNLVKNAIDFIMKNVPLGNKAFPLIGAARNPAMKKDFWPWFKNNIQELEKLHPYHFGYIIDRAIPRAGIHHKNDVEKYLKEYAQKPQGKMHDDIIKVALEKLEINYTFLKRHT